jgi:hypothetical protein
MTDSIQSQNTPTCIHSSNGFISSVWGPVLWFLIHTFSFKSNIKIFKSWFKTLQYVLPCGACRDNFLSNLKQCTNNHNNIYSNRDNLTFFIYNFHNVVNDCLNKTKPYPSYTNIKTLYTDPVFLYKPRHIRIICNNKNNNNIIPTGISLSDIPLVTPYTKSSQTPHLMKPWWFMILVCTLNFPLSNTTKHDNVRILWYKRWFMYSIYALPDMFSKTKSLLLDCIAIVEHNIGHSLYMCETRDHFVSFVLNVLYMYNIQTLGHCERIENIITKYEALRATNCSKSTKFKKGTCKKDNKSYICKIISLLENPKNEQETDYCFLYN